MAPRTTLLAAVLILSTALHAQIAAWDFFGENIGVATSAAEVYNANMDASNLVSRGAGAVASSASNSFRTTGFQNNGISTANTDYFQCTLSSAPGYTLSVSTLDARFAGTATFAVAPGVSGQFAYSLDGTNFTPIGSPTITVGSPATLPQIDLTGIPALQSLADGIIVTFRYYASGQTATGGWGFNSPAAGQYGLAIGGSLTPLVVNTSVAFNGSSATVLESVGTTPINVSISNPSPGNATTADVVLTSGDATRINNYTTQTVTFPANTSTDQLVTITVTDNLINDGNAALVFQLQNVTGGQGTASAGAPSSYTLNITDNEAPPTVSVNSVSFTEANSGTTNALVSVTMNAPPASTVVVSLADALTGSATAATDYGTVTPASLVFLTTDVYPFTQSVSIPVFGDTDVEPNETVNYTVSITSGPATLGTSSGTLTITNDDYTALVINEVDSDSPGADVAEFVELYGPANASLNGLTVVFFNGSNDLSYASFDLDGYTLDANGFFVLGNAAVTGVDVVFASNLLQNGADAVAVYFADATSFPTNSPVTTANLIDAIVYDTDDADDAGLLVLLNPGQPQVNENGGANGQGQSNSRFPDGGVALNTFTYVQQFPTPDGSNAVICDLVLQPHLAVCNSVTAGPGDTYTVSIPYTGVEPGVVVVNNSGSGTVGGDDPAVTTNGTIVVSGISEANNYSITFSAPCNTLTVTGTAPTCEPLPAIVINEVDYDQPGTDNAEFIELRNNGASAFDLAGCVLQLVNGSGGGASVYAPSPITLPSYSLAPGAYYVVCATGSAVPNCNLFVTGFTLQNGVPDAVGLRDASNNLLDAVSYGGSTGAPYTETAGAPTDPSQTTATAASIGRFPDGTDTNNNALDFVVSCVNTPGAANNAATDTDGDTVIDCVDGCPNDPLKTAPGLCGCGVPDTDTDGDFAADCIDGCPLDPNKIVPGACGCGVPDVDTDGDLVEDCNDGCPLDAMKIAPGACGCGVVDVDTDGDLIADCIDGCPTDPNKITPGICGCGVADTDTDADGTANCIDGCPTDPNKIAPGTCGCGVVDVPNGTACDADNNPCTLDQYVTCVCTFFANAPDQDNDGTCDAIDTCPSVAGQIGSTCNDNNACTVNDVLTANCVCAGTFADADNDGTCDANDLCAGPEPGTACNDNNACTTGDVIGANCLCAGTFADADADGTCDANDLCAGGPEPGNACNDNDANTINDVVGANCLCTGTPIGVCTQNELTLTLTTDNNGAQTSWEIVPSAGGAPFCSGGGYASNSTITATCCVPDGCYNLRVLDTFGDGLNSGPTGGWVLRDANNERILDNADDGIWTGPVAQAPDAFCLPIGTDRLTTATCDQETVTSAFTLQIVENAAVTAQFGVTNSTSGYQFWIYNPDGSYSRRVAFTHAAAGSSAPTGTPSAVRSSFLRLNTLTTNPVPSFTLLNVRVRARVAGVYAQYGPACRMKVDPTANCQATQLTTTADPVISCGATGLLLNGINQLHAVAVPGANKYQFRFTRPGYTRNIATSTRSLTLAEWATNPLQLGQCYDVVVRVSFDNGGAWCAYGTSCQVCMAAAPPANGSSRSVAVTEEATLTMWPNPNRGEQLYLTLDHVNEAVTTATVDIFDLVGKKVNSRTIAANGSTVNTVIDLDGSLSSGIYVVNLTAGEQTFTQRLVIQ